MPGALRWLRVSAIRRKRVLRYLSYATGEVILVFIGISLAIAFENSNERRRVARLEHDLLLAIQRNLGANLDELDRNIQADSTSLSYLEPLIDHLSRELPWHDSLSIVLSNAFPWSSPYLDYSAYESLKQLGLQVVSSDTLRDELVQLYEGTYARLRGDQDLSQWAFYESVILPIRIRELDVVEPLAEGRTFRVRNYRESLDRGDLLATLAQHRFNLRDGLDSRRTARSETQHLIEGISAYLSGL